MESMAYKGTMTSRERVRAALNYAPSDRVPVNYIYNPGIDLRLKEYFGLNPADNEGLRQALGVDFRALELKYTGPKLYADIEGRKIDPLYGYRTRWAAHENGGYWEYCDFPLREATMEIVEAWPFPDPDHFDYEALIPQCENYKDYALFAGDNGNGLVICRSSFYRGMEQALVDLVLDDPAGLRLVDRFLEFQFQVISRVLDKAGKYLTFMWMGEDLGTQIGPLIGMEAFKKHILPRQKRFIDLAASYGLPSMLHTCGSSSWSYEEYIAAGLKAVDTLQPEAANMSPRYLKEHFGGRLAFHGCISTAGPLTFGTPEQVTADVRDTLEIMMPGGGYLMCTTHRMQDNMPVENAVAMYRAAHRYGRYK